MSHLENELRRDDRFDVLMDELKDSLVYISEEEKIMRAIQLINEESY